MPALQEEDIPWRSEAGTAYFTSYVPIAEEYRVWVFQEAAIATVIRRMRFPAKYRGLGRNFDDGFVFERAEPQQKSDRLAVKAVKAVGLDFGAVDLALGKDGDWHVFEVNSAPGVSGANSMLVTAFTEKVAEWYRSVV